MLRERVIEGLTKQGLHVEEDRGGLLVRNGEGDHTVSIWVDETDRVVRAEEVLCYPIDDFSEPLCLALDWLNQNRVGVTYNYQEAQRALVASTVWTSPSRDPSNNQLHLLVGLLQDARDRDADALARVAEGEASWEEVAGEAAPPPRPASGGGRRSEAQTLKFATSVYSASEVRGEEPPVGEGGYVEPPTRPFGRISDGSYGAEDPDDARTTTGSYRHLSDSGRLEPAMRPPTGSISREEIEERSREPEGGGVQPLDSSNIDEFRPTAAARTPRRTSRQALQLAVQAVDNREHAKQDLVVQRSPGFRMFKCLIWLVIILAIGAVLFERIVRPFMDQRQFTMEYWFPTGPVVSEEEQSLTARNAMTSGRELLVLELEKPLADSEKRLKRSMLALGEQARAVLETKIVQGTSVEVRKRAYQLWTEYGYRDLEGARLRLLKQITAVGQKRAVIVGYLSSDLTDKPPSDEVITKALKWVKGDVWLAFVARLGRPQGPQDEDKDAAEKRAKVLTTQLERDTADCLVLRSLIQTGHGPEGSTAILIQKRGLEWSRGPGRSLCVKLLTTFPNDVDLLLQEGKKQEIRLVALELLAATKTPQANKKLIAVLWDRKNSLWVRQKATLGLKSIASPASTVSLVWVLNRKEDTNLLRDVKRALQAIPDRDAIGKLKKYLDPKRKESARRSAVRGLGAIQTPRAVDALVVQLKADPSVKVRLLVLEQLGALQKQKALLKSLQRKCLVPLRDASFKDSDDRVRREAKRLYRSLSGL